MIESTLAMLISTILGWYCSTMVSLNIVVIHITILNYSVSKDSIYYMPIVICCLSSDRWASDCPQFVGSIPASVFDFLRYHILLVILWYITLIIAVLRVK